MGGNPEDGKKGHWVIGEGQRGSTRIKTGKTKKGQSYSAQHENKRDLDRFKG